MAETEMMILCPFHDDKNPSASVNLDTGVWYCFAGCGGGSLFDLYERIRRDGDFVPVQPDRYDAEKTPILRSWSERGITPRMIHRWGIEWDDDVKAMRFPVYGLKGEVLWSIWRAPEGVMPKYRYQRGAKKSMVLYGLWRLPSELTHVVLVEGPLDALWVQEAGWPGVAVLGSRMSREQLGLLMERKVGRVIICSDNDEAGDKLASEAIRDLRRSGLWVLRVQIPKRYKDIQEVALGAVPHLLQQAQLCVNGGGGMIGKRFQHWLGRAFRR